MTFKPNPFSRNIPQPDGIRADQWGGGQPKGFVDSVYNDGGTTIVDETGLTVTAGQIGDSHTTITANGIKVNDGSVDRVVIGNLGSDYGLKVLNGSSTVIIDGTSDMFRISATGTISRTWPAAGTGATTTTTLSSLGTFTTPPVVVHAVVADNGLSTNARVLSRHQFWNVATGALIYQAFGYWVLNGSSQLVVGLEADTISASPGNPASARYYVLAQTAI